MSTHNIYFHDKKENVPKTPLKYFVFLSFCKNFLRTQIWALISHDKWASWNFTVYDIPYYGIYPKYSDTSTPYHICSKIWTSTIHYPMLCLKITGWVANSVDPDETPRSEASHLGLNCLLRPVCPNTYGKYGRINYLTCSYKRTVKQLTPPSSHLTT